MTINLQNFVNQLKYAISIGLLIFTIIYPIQTEAQEANESKYRRSSLSMILIESDDFPNKEAVMDSWDNYPFPDKYNAHNIPIRSFGINSIELTDEELQEAGFLLDTLKNPLQIAKANATLKPLKYLNEEETVAVVLPTEKQEYQLKIDKVINDKEIAKLQVAKWFNRGADGKFNMDLIQERGFYNATELEASIAKGQTRGLASLADAGEELIRNTFVTFTKLDFKENEPVARMIRDAAKEQIAQSMQGKPQLLIDKANQAADAVYEKTKEGYSLWSKTWLYRLNWNDSIAAVFYNQLWSDPAAFDESELFSLEFVGVQYNQSLVTFKIGEKRTPEQIIDLTLVRNVDNAFSKLQKENDVFKPKVPVLSTNPITAKIGKKESLEGGEKFEILEMYFDPQTGLTKYKKIGTAKVDKKYIWDNRYAVNESSEEVGDSEEVQITATFFKGGGSKIQPGMLLKQLN